MVNTFEFIKPFSDTVFEMINTVYHDKPLILSGLRFGRSLSPIIRQMVNTFEFIKPLSDTVFEMINTIYHDKPLFLSRLRFVAVIKELLFIGLEQFVRTEELKKFYRQQIKGQRDSSHLLNVSLPGKSMILMG